MSTVIPGYQPGIGSRSTCEHGNPRMLKSRSRTSVSVRVESGNIAATVLDNCGNCRTIVDISLLKEVNIYCENIIYKNVFSDSSIDI